jgi:hypothetical protein
MVGVKRSVSKKLTLIGLVVACIGIALSLTVPGIWDLFD